MKLYQSKTITLSIVKEKPFKLEREIQQLFEANLEEIMNLELVKSEFIIKNKRIDTLAYDKQSQAFIIIEYKRDKNHSVVDQGLTYLNLMLQNKAEFILTYNETLNKTLHSKDIDWSQSRIAFISTSFTENQISASDFKDFGIELWEVKRFENDVVTINSIKKSNAAQSIKPLIENKAAFEAVKQNIKVYSEEEHLNGKNEDTLALYNSFKTAILNLDIDIDIKPKKQEIGFTQSGKIFTDVCILKNSLKIWINLKRGQLDDTKQVARDVSSIGHWGNGDYELIVNDTSNIEYMMYLIQQAIKQ